MGGRPGGGEPGSLRYATLGRLVGAPSRWGGPGPPHAPSTRAKARAAPAASEQGASPLQTPTNTYLSTGLCDEVSERPSA